MLTMYATPFLEDLTETLNTVIELKDRSRKGEVLQAGIYETGISIIACFCVHP